MKHFSQPDPDIRRASALIALALFAGIAANIIAIFNAIN